MQPSDLNISSVSLQLSKRKKSKKKELIAHITKEQTLPDLKI